MRMRMKMKIFLQKKKQKRDPEDIKNNDNKDNNNLLAYIVGKQTQKKRGLGTESTAGSKLKTLSGNTLIISRFDQQLINTATDMDHYGNVGSNVGYLYQAAAIIISRKSNL